MISEALKKYQEYVAKKLSLDITRGQPATAQFDLSDDLLTAVTKEDITLSNGLDVRNYGGGVAGIDEARELFAPVLEVDPDLMIIGDNSSLALMGKVLSWAMLCGVPGGKGPWNASGAVKFLCPVPGYDRHFTMLETLGIEMVTVQVNEEGLDMQQVEDLVAEDEQIKGIWLVPKYSNPTGITLSDEVVKRLGQLQPKAPDFRIFADNAYAVHHIYPDRRDTLKNMYEACVSCGNEDMIYLFGSTSKVTYSGAGIGFMAASPNNRDHLLKLFGTHTIGPNKLEQLRHVRFFQSVPDGIEAHMKAHADIVRPKFESSLAILDRELGSAGIATWTKPLGGYFISLDTAPGLAKRTVELASQAGVKLTPAGATYPYKKDPTDTNIRIAPTRPVVEQVEQAMEVLCCCVQVAAEEQGI